MHIIGNNMERFVYARVCVYLFLFMFTPLSHTDTQVVIMNDLLFYNKHGERRAAILASSKWRYGYDVATKGLMEGVFCFGN